MRRWWSLSIYHYKLLFNKMSKTVNCLREDGGYFEVIPQFQRSHSLCMYGNMAYKTKAKKKIVCAHYIDSPSFL